MKMRKCLMIFLVSSLACAQEEVATPVRTDFQKLLNDMNDEQRKQTLVELLTFVDKGRQAFAAESMPSVASRCLWGTVGFVLASGLVGAQSRLDGKGKRSVSFEQKGLIVAGLSGLFCATKVAEWVAGWWNGSRNQSKKCDQAAKHFAAAIKGESLSENDINSALEVVEELGDRELKENLASLERLGITDSMFTFQGSAQGSSEK